MKLFSRVARPAVWLMSSATNALLALVNSETPSGPSVSVDDIEHMIDTGAAKGVVESVEKQVAVEALRLASAPFATSCGRESISTHSMPTRR